MTDLPDPLAYVARWDAIRLTVTDIRLLAARWDAEADLRQKIRQAYPDLLSGPIHGGQNHA